MSLLTGNNISLDGRDFSRQHHKQAYQSLVMALNKAEALQRRMQLDAWLKQHSYVLEQGMNWEGELQSLDWTIEYRQVIRSALKRGVFYSDAFQKQLHHCYIESGRLTLEKQDQLHQSELARLQKKPAQHLSRFRTLHGWLLSMATVLQIVSGR